MVATGKVAASRAHGRWLQRQRQARGWSVAEMRRRLREAARLAGDNLPANDSLTVMIHRWEDDRSGVSERYRLHVRHEGALLYRPRSGQRMEEVSLDLMPYRRLKG